jgi:hypothetical protein
MENIPHVKDRAPNAVKPRKRKRKLVRRSTGRTDAKRARFDPRPASLRGNELNNPTFLKRLQEFYNATKVDNGTESAFEMQWPVHAFMNRFYEDWGY